MPLSQAEHPVQCILPFFSADWHEDGNPACSWSRSQYSEKSNASLVVRADYERLVFGAAFFLVTTLCRNVTLFKKCGKRVFSQNIVRNQLSPMQVTDYKGLHCGRRS